MNACLIVTSFLEGRDRLSLNKSDFDYIIAADGGLLHADALDLTPDAFIGDYDSMEKPERDNLILLPRVKDLTDSEAALNLAVEQGYTEITVLGGLGGRFDHTMGNIGLLLKYRRMGVTVHIMDGYNEVTMLVPGTYQIAPENYRYFGLIAFSPEVENLCISGAKYPLDHYTLTNDTTLGVSNEVAEEYATVSFSKGDLLLIRSNEAG